MSISRAILLSSLLLCASAHAEKARVIEVIDGDQLRVRRGKAELVVRIFGIDAPEPGQPFGAQAKERLAKLVKHKVVGLVPVGEGSRSRVVARVRVGPRQVGEELLKAGLAWHFKAQDRSKYYKELEGQARAAGRGLWAVKGRIPPWKWRGEKDPEEPLGTLIGNKIGESYGSAAVDVTHPITGDLARKVAHWFTCPRARCKRCTAHYKSLKEARRAGLRPHRACLATAACFDRCLQDNAQRAEAIEAIEASCRAHCQSASPPPAKAPPVPELPWSESRRCKRHRDCVFAFHPCSPCPACTPAWRSVTNRATYRRQVRRYSRMRVKCAPCRPCPDGKNQWLGTRAVCVKGQCRPR